MLVVALLFGSSMGTPVAASSVLSAIPAPPIDLPPASEDQDRDTYADDVDRVFGDATVRVSLDRLDAGDIHPYFLLGTQDDHWRMGAGQELEWRHVVDADPLGHAVGSKAWTDHALRTGAWWYSVPMEGETKSVAKTGVLEDAPAGTEWPQVIHLNVRDDRPTVTVRIELMDTRPSPDRVVAIWDIAVDVPSGDWSHVGASHLGGEQGRLLASAASLDITVSVHAGIPREEQEAIAERWAPEIRFAKHELFFPTSGEVLQRFHGFGRTAPTDQDLRTWTRDFNNGRDGYVLLLADFNGDRVVDHRDVHIMTDVLREGGVAQDTVYAHVFDTTGDRVVVQFWFIYIYNFVEDESGDGIPILAHRGDREFVQLTFASRDEARNGTPSSVAFSQHYRGMRITDPAMDEGPFSNGTLLVYPARGSHASYPEAGNDLRFRPALAGYGDFFDGQGEHWAPGNYTLEHFDRQDWAFGHLWGPPTRHSRELGTAGKPFLQYAFRYPYIDPVAWELRLKEFDQDQLTDLYGGPP